MKKIKVRVPGTTANLGPGFDCLGLALTIYNTFTFEENFQWKFINFEEKYANDMNLIVRSMRKVYEKANKQLHPFTISIDEQVPISRGLGSSATCIIGGIVAANHFLNYCFNEQEMIKIATEIEGHPDNIAPAFFGSLVSSVNGEKIITVKHNIDESLRFIVAIPDFSLSTKEAREVIPSKISYADAIYNMSRAINIPKALENGDLEMLLSLMKDKMHQPFRFPLIKDADVFMRFAEEKRIPFCLSGSGSTLLMITKTNLIPELQKLVVTANWRFLELKPDIKGTTLEVLS
ncbi:MAG TPA: homoserine kinase [Bacilli bacterium]|nr:homoserine kinase [Bacilli bacterium]